MCELEDRVIEIIKSEEQEKIKIEEKGRAIKGTV